MSNVDCGSRMVLSALTSWTSTLPRSHSRVTLLLTYCVTRRRCSSLHDDTLGTTAPGVPSWCGTICHPCDTDSCELFSGVSPCPRLRIDFTVEPHLLAFWIRALMSYPNTRLPSTGILIGLDDTNLTCIVTIANANDLATTSMQLSRVFQSIMIWYPSVGIDSCSLVNLELYPSFFPMQVVPILYKVQDRNVPEELLKPVSHSTTCTSGASWSRPPPS